MTSNSDVPLFAVWGSSGSDVFAVGWSGAILHYDGATWSAMSSGAALPLAVCGGAAPATSCRGDPGLILHYDGTHWVIVATGMCGVLSAVWGSGGNDVFAVGNGGPSSLRRNNLECHGQRHLSGSKACGGVASDIFAVGWGGAIVQDDGTSWRAMASGRTPG